MSSPSASRAGIDAPRNAEQPVAANAAITANAVSGTAKAARGMARQSLSA